MNKSDLDLADEVVAIHNDTVKQVTLWLQSMSNDIDQLFGVFKKVSVILPTSGYYEWDFIMDMTEHRSRYEVIPVIQLIDSMMDDSDVELSEDEEVKPSVLLTKEQQKQSIKMMTSGFGKITVDW